ncbi:MAG TPA: glycoside hydrolase family 2 TIM barrel-domain containing protein [Verrucomicrobiae bacterium]|jgi:beta-galactosidase|nr:glycoside hydrolase family 2 TIM barrel-domain containing protein [Verrucomicrobiae bacterium]
MQTVLRPLATAILFTLTVALSAQTYAPPATGRTDAVIDQGWRFTTNAPAGAETPGLDDSAWSAVTLPHTWNNRDGQDGGKNYYRGAGWYRLHLPIDAGWAGRHFFLKFDGAFSVADVYVNGVLLGEKMGGFAAFAFDATANLQVGADNVIAVNVNNAFNTNLPPLNADFTFFGGLYRDVHLLVTGPVQISPLDCASPGVYLQTTAVSAASAHLQITTVLSNAGPVAAAMTWRAVVVDAASNTVAALTNDVTLPAGASSNVVAATTILQPHLWDGLADPYLYHVYVELADSSNVVDWVEQPLGFRWFSVDSTNGFFLNGRHYDLHGVNMHQDWLNDGWAVNSAQRATNIAVLKELGATFLRLSHYEHNDETYQLADENGLCVWSEVPVIDYVTISPAFNSNTLTDLRDMIRQRGNHPSVVCWSVFNEVTLQAGPIATNVIAQETKLVAQEDPTRPSVAAANSSDNDPTTFYTQLIGFNKYYGWYSTPLNGIGAWADKIHANYPNRCVGVTEYGAGGSHFQHTENPSFPANTATGFHPEEWQNIVHETNWQMMAARPFLWCKLLWTSFDFASDGRNEGDTPGRNDKGLVTYDRLTRKDAFYYYKANWTTNPMVYITARTFTNRQANAITAKVYANCNPVELFVNGASQGQVTSSNCIYTWPINLAAGTNFITAACGTVTDAVMWIAPTPPPSITNLSAGLIAWWKMDGTNDASGQGRGLTLSGGAYFTNDPAGFPAHVLHLDGKTGVAAFASPDVTQLTISAWARASSHGNSAFPRIFDTPGYRLFFRFDNQGSNGFDFATYSTGNGDWFSGAGTIAVGGWYHVMASYDLSNLSAFPAEYAQGGAVYPSVITTPSGAQPSSAGLGYLGNTAALNRAWSGDLADVRIYNRILNPTEARLLAAPSLPLTVTPAASALTLSWPTNAGNWLLQYQSNTPSAGLTTNWTPLPGPISNPFLAPVYTNGAAVFYRLKLTNL